MAAEENVATYRRLIEQGFGRGDLGVVDEFVAPDFREHMRLGPGLPPGPEGLRATIRGLRASFPDLTLTVEDLAADEDKVWARVRGRATHLGPLMGMPELPPTGKQVEIEFIDVCRFEGGRLAEHWGISDRFAMMEQLGLLPQPHAPAVRPA